MSQRPATSRASATRAGGKSMQQQFTMDNTETNPQVIELQKRCAAYERLLQAKSENLNTALEVQNQLQERIRELHDQLECERADAIDIRADMTRQFQSMQQDLFARLHSSGEENQRLLARVQSAESRLQALESNHEAEKAALEDQVEKLNAKIGAMTAEFSTMLQDILQRMGTHFQSVAQDFSPDAMMSSETQAKLAEFGLDKM